MGRRRLTDEEREERRLARLARISERYRTDPAFREQMKERTRAWRAANPDKALAQSRRAELNRVRDPEKQREYWRSRYLQLRDAPEYQAYVKAYREATKAWNRGYQRAYYQTNKKKMNEQSHAYYLTHTEVMKETSRIHWMRHRGTERYQSLRRNWVERNRDKIRQRRREWKRSDAGRARSVDDSHIRRARLRSLPWERIDRQVVFQRDGFVCQICGEPTIPGDRYLCPSVDHIVPIAKGGPHLYENVQTAHYICNCRKGSRLMASTASEGGGAI